jgi:hypothetical protein
MRGVIYLKVKLLVSVYCLFNFSNYLYEILLKSVKFNINLYFICLYFLYNVEHVKE